MIENEILNKNLESLQRIERNSLLAAKNVLTIDDVAILTGFKKNYVYRLTCEKKLPYYRPNGKTIYFEREDIEAWMRRNRSNTVEKAERQAIAHELRKEA